MKGNGYEARQTSKAQSKMPRFRLEGPRPCTIFWFALIHYAWVTYTFLLVSSSVQSKQLLCFVQGQGQKSEQKPTTKNLVGLHNYSSPWTMLRCIWSLNVFLIDAWCFLVKVSTWAQNLMSSRVFKQFCRGIFFVRLWFCKEESVNFPSFLFTTLMTKLGKWDWNLNEVQVCWVLHNKVKI